MSSTNLCVEEKKKRCPAQEKSDSLCTNSTVKLLTTRKLNPYLSATMQVAFGQNGTHHRANHPSFVTQRVLSAKAHRLKQLQNQLADAHYHLNELITENRILRTLQKKQEMALSRYESSNAELPRVLGAHAEEMRVQVAKYKNVKQQNKEIIQKLKERETELQQLKDEHKHLLMLNKEKNLMEREQLQSQLEEYKEKCQRQEETIAMLQRRLMLEAKNHRHQMEREIMKHKDTRNDLDLAITNADKLTSILELKERMLGNVMAKRGAKSPPRKSEVRPLSKTRRTVNLNKEVEQNSKESRPLTGKSRGNASNLDDIFQNKSATSLTNNKQSENNKRIKTPEKLEIAKMVQEGMSDLDILFKEDLDFEQLPANEAEKKVEEMKSDLLKKIKAEETPSRVSSGSKRGGSGNRSRKGSGVSFEFAKPEPILNSSKSKNEMKNYKDLVSDIESKTKVIDKHVEEFGSAKFDNDKILEQLKALDEMNELVKDDNILNLAPETLEELNNNFKLINKTPQIPQRRSRNLERKKVREIFGDGDMSNKDILNDILRKAS